MVFLVIMCHWYTSPLCHRHRHRPYISLYQLLAIWIEMSQSDKKGVFDIISLTFGGCSFHFHFFINNLFSLSPFVVCMHDSVVAKFCNYAWCLYVHV